MKKIKMSVRLNSDEYLKLKRDAKTTGLKMEPYIRSLIMNTEIQPRPPDEYFKLIREINAIGNNINQIAHIANANGSIGMSKINAAVKMVDDIMDIIRGV